MSQIVRTEHGRFRAVIRDGQKGFLFECPGCGEWGPLDEDQMNGRVSVDHASMECKGGYHETHEFGKGLLAAMLSHMLTSMPFEEDTP